MSASPKKNTEVAEVVDFVEPEDSTAAEFFVSAPTIVFPTIDKATRLDMIDYFMAGSDKPSRNLAEGECRITSLSPECLTFSSSEVSEYTIAVLPSSKKNGEPIIMLVRTLKTPAEDSTTKFYNSHWEEISGIFEVPELSQWLNEDGKQKRKEVENAVPFVLAKLAYSPDNKELTLTNKLGDYIPEESLGLAQGSLHQHLSFRWNGKKFIPVKK